MSYLCLYIILLLPYFVYAQIEKDVIGRVTGAQKSGSWHHIAFVSQYGYDQNSILKNDNYVVRSGTNNIRYRIDSVSYTSLLTGFNARLMLTPMDGYSGAFPVSVAAIYRPQGTLNIGLADPSAPAFLTNGIVNENLIKIAEAIDSGSNFIIYGSFPNDAAAGSAGCPIGGFYILTAANTYGHKQGTLVQRIN